MNSLTEHIEICCTALAACARGPWHNEPHYYEWWYLGYRCVVLRDANGLHLCGYIALRHDHPWSARSVESLPVYCHEALHWSQGFFPVNSVEHYGSWWIGFSCGGMKDRRPSDKSSCMPYRDFDFVQEEIKSIVSQAKKVARNRTWGGKRA